MKEKHNLTLNDWDSADKPREKMINLSRKNLTEAELLAIIIGSGVPGQNVVDLAKEIYASADQNLMTLSRYEIADFKRFNGIGDAKAVGIVAAMELATRLYQKRWDEKEVIVHESKDIAQYISPLISDLNHEEFHAIYFNSRNKVIGRELICKGGLNTTPVDIRLIFKGALKCNATATAVAHNHPSGSFVPSQNDKTLTTNIYEASRLMRITLLDHLIVGIDPSGKPGFFSFHDEGYL